MGLELDDAMVISAIMASLPSSIYASFLDTWSMLDLEQQSLAKFVDKILGKTKMLVQEEQLNELR